MHQKIKLTAIIFFVILISLAHAQTERSLLVKYLASQKKYYQNSWAVLIGINNFKYLPPTSKLDYAVKDAEEIKELLIQEFGFKSNNIILLTDEQATLRTIMNELSYELPRKVGENDRALIFWAGHGHTQDLSPSGEMGFLIPSDGNITNLESTCISMDAIKKVVDSIPAKHVLLLVDACYSGLVFEKLYKLENFIRNLDERYLNIITSSNGRQIITAGKRDQPVLERSDWGHSAFTFKLIEGLKHKLADSDNDGIITAIELGNFLIPSVTKLSNYRQTPQYGTEGEGLFVLIPEPENIPPQISNLTKDLAKAKRAFLIQANVTDDRSGVANVLLAFKNKSADNWEKVAMHQQSDNSNIYEYIIPANQVKPPRIDYYFLASDKAGNKTRLPKYLDRFFKIKVKGSCTWCKWVIPPVAVIVGYIIYINLRGEIDITAEIN
ncbi:MAG: caspase domain-containing protein [Candidatus Hodarchaeota archaeon]